MFVNSLCVSVTAAEVTNPKRPFIASLFAPFPCQPPSDVTDEHSFNLILILTPLGITVSRHIRQAQTRTREPLLPLPAEPL